MRICIIVPELGNGGAERHALRIALSMAEAGHTITIFTCRAGGCYEALARLSRVEVVAGQPVPLGRSSLVSVLGSIPALRDHLRRWKPDVSVSFLPHTALALVWAQRWAGSRAALVIGQQNNHSMELAGRANWAWRRVHRLLPYTTGKADAIVALSHGVARDLGERYPRMRAKLHTIYNAGYDEATLRQSAEPSRLAKPAGKVLVACGRLVPQKDYGTLLRAFALVQERQPDVNLWILGEGPERKWLEETIARSPHREKVRLLGFQANPFALLRQADTFVLSSRWEGFGNVIVEAMALGVPVVSTDCPFGPGEILEQGKHGLLTPVGDAPALAAAILRVLSDPALADALRKAGPTRAADFAASAVARDYLALFDELIHS